MTLTPTKQPDVAQTNGPEELLIREAQRRTRRRRIRVGVLLVVLAVLIAMLIAGGRRSSETKGPASHGTVGSMIAGVPFKDVANLAGANTITASSSHVWVTINRETGASNFFALTELNATNGSLVRVIKNKPRAETEPGFSRRVGDLTEPGYMVVSGSHLWVGDDQYWNVTELNATSGSLTRVINAKADGLAYPGGVAVSGGHVWVANSHVGANSVTELNASNGSLVRVINAKADGFSGPSAVAVSQGHVFVLNATGDSITELNGATGALIRILNPHAGCCAPRNGTFESAGPVALSVSGRHLWVANLHNDANGATQQSSVAEFNVSNGSLVRVINAKADRLHIPRAIAVSRGHVWVLNADNTMTELDATTGSLVRVVELKLDSRGLNSADGLAIAGRDVAILNIYSGQKGSVTVINARSGKLVRVIG